MRKTLTAMRKFLPIAVLTFAALALIAGSISRTNLRNPFANLLIDSAEAQALGGGPGNVSFPRFAPATITFTATSQNSVLTLPSVQSAVIKYAGSGVTTATFQFLASNDGGTTYIGIPYSDGTYATNVLHVVTGATITQTANAAVDYWVNLSDMDHLKIATSGTFTATNITFVVTASANKGLF